MGNPFIRSEASQHQPAQPVESSNGVLTLVPGEIIGSASRQLPPAGKGQPETADAVVNVPNLGFVRITYRLNSYSHGRSKHWHWQAVRAERVGETPRGPSDEHPADSQTSETASGHRPA